MKKLYTLMLCLALLVLAACSDNLFGSSPPGSGNDVKSLRIDAEAAFRKGDYESSYNICKKIVDIDPSSSFGYFGMAKAGLWWHGVNPLSIFSLVMVEDEGDECPFMGADMKTQNNYLQAMKKVVDILPELDRRDTLTALYERYKKGESLNDKDLSEFASMFCNNNTKNCKDTTGKNESFPLSDREYKGTYFRSILLLSTFTKTILNLFDTNNDNCLAKRVGLPGIDNPGDPNDVSKWEKWGCQKDYSGKFGYDLPLSLKCPKDSTGKMSVVIDSKQILEELQSQLYDYYESLDACTKDCNNIKIPPEIGSINERIDNFDGDFKDVEDVLNNLGLGGSTDSLGEIDQGSIKDEIDKYKAYASFYKVGTHIDEDGDGCIDEELIEGKDNDGDGFINENSRLASVDPSHPLFGVNAMNNSMYGDNPYRDNDNWEYNKPVRLPAPVKICNSSDGPNCSLDTELWGDEETGKVTVIGFTQKKYPDGSEYWTTKDMELKLAIARDTACPPQFNLEFRVKKIGGCWPHYDKNKFVKYWLKRELAHPDDQATRVHPSCRICNGVEGCLGEK